MGWNEEDVGISNYRKRKRYGRRKAVNLQLLYFFSAIGWILLVLVLGITRLDLLSLLILSIPLILYGIAFANISDLSADVEEELFQSTYLSAGLLVIVPLLTWINRESFATAPIFQKEFVNVLIVSVVLTLFSLLDAWVPRRWLSAVRHIRSVLQTASITLIVYALYVSSVSFPNALFK